MMSCLSCPKLNKVSKVVACIDVEHLENKWKCECWYFGAGLCLMQLHCFSVKPEQTETKLSEIMFHLCSQQTPKKTGFVRIILLCTLTVT